MSSCAIKVNFAAGRRGRKSVQGIPCRFGLALGVGLGMLLPRCLVAIYPVAICRASLCLVALCLVALSPVALSPVAGQVVSERVEIVMIDGSTRSLELQTLGEEPGLQAADGQVFALDEIKELRTPYRLLGDDPTALTVLLRGNGVLYARTVAARDGQVTIGTDLAEIEYPLLDIRGIRLPTPEGEPEWQALLDNPSKEEDRLLVTTSRGPRVVAGLLEALDPEGVRIVFEDAERRVTMDKILALVPAQLDDSAEPKYQIRLVDRSILVADSVDYRGQTWTFRRRQQTISFPAELVVSLGVRSDRVLFLSELDPIVDEIQTLIAPPAVNQRDLSVMGSPLTVMQPTPSGHVARVFSKGWGVRSRSRLAFEIPEGFRELRGWVGIDPATNGQGHCDAMVLIDGIQMGSWSLDGRRPAQEVQIPIEAGRRLELRVEPGQQLDLSDWVNWADVRLIK